MSAAASPSTGPVPWPPPAPAPMIALSWSLPSVILWVPARLNHAVKCGVSSRPLNLCTNGTATARHSIPPFASEGLQIPFALQQLIALIEGEGQHGTMHCASFTADAWHGCLKASISMHQAVGRLSHLDGRFCGSRVAVRRHRPRSVRAWQRRQSKAVGVLVACGLQRQAQARQARRIHLMQRQLLPRPYVRAATDEIPTLNITA